MNFGKSAKMVFWPQKLLEMGIVCPQRGENSFFGHFPARRMESFQEVHFLGVEGRMPQSYSLTLRIRNPNQIVRLHFMHQNRPKEVIETSICDIECSKSSKIP